MNTMLLDSVTAARVEDNLPRPERLGELAAFFDALSDVTRLKLVSALAVSAMCVTDLSALTAINQTTVSHQLRILRSARIVRPVRQGKVVFYSLTGRSLPKLMSLAVETALAN